jgi:hypothetical protein
VFCGTNEFLTVNHNIISSVTTTVVFAVLPSSTYLFTAGVEVVYFHLITLRHTPHSVGRGIGPPQRPLPDNINTHKRQTSMSPMGFEPTIPASARPQTYALDRAATVVYNATKYSVPFMTLETSSILCVCVCVCVCVCTRSSAWPWV